MQLDRSSVGASVGTSTPPVSGGAGPAHHGVPPGPRYPAFLQYYRWVRDPVAFLESGRRRFGRSFTMSRLLGGHDFVFLGDPEAVRDVFAGDPEVFHAGEANFLVENVLGRTSVLVLDGAVHQRERRRLNPPFHGDRMRAYGGVMRALADDAVDAFPVGEPFAAMPRMQETTLAVILRTVFGLDEEERHGALRDALRDMLDAGSNPALYALAILVRPERLQRVIMRLAQPIDLPGGRTLDPSDYVPGGAMFRLLQRLDALLFAEFSRRRTLDLAGREDVLSLLLAFRDEEGAPMSDVWLRDQMVTLLTAGHETTAVTLAWALRHLAEHPDVAARAVAEIERVTGGGPVGADHVGALEYVGAIVNETMRLTPVVPAVARVLKRPAQLGDRLYPAGAFVLPSIYLVHHDEQLWPEPHAFRPERFLGKPPAPHEFFPFGGGVRRCLGAAFATYEMKIVLGTMIRRIRLAPPAGPVRLERRGILLAPTGGAPIRIREVLPRRAPDLA